MLKYWVEFQIMGGMGEGGGRGEGGGGWGQKSATGPAPPRLSFLLFLLVVEKNNKKNTAGSLIFIGVITN